jgi:putative transposase
MYGTLLTAATKNEFLLKFAKDRKCWLHWLFEARKRFGLCVLNYIITSNHIHLLVCDRGQGEIKKSMQLVAGRTAQEYNQRKDRKVHSGKTAIMRPLSIQKCI